MEITKCPCCSGSTMHVPVPATLKQFLGADWSNFWQITFLRCKECGSIYWRTRCHYVSLYFISAAYFLFIGMILSVFSGILESKFLGIVCTILGFLRYHYTIVICTAHLPWKKVVIQPGDPPAQKRKYLAIVQSTGIITGILFVLWVLC